MKAHSQRFAWFSLSALLLVAPLSGATTLARMSLGKMSQTAKAIVRARCLANETGRDAGEIWTFTSFEIQETWRGDVASHIVVRLLGGKLGAVTSTVSGVPRFRPGEEVVLFLEPTPRGDFSIVSWEQGTFRIRRDVLTNEEYVTQDTASLETFDPATRQFSTAGIHRMPLHLLREHVDAALSSGDGRHP